MKNIQTILLIVVLILTLYNTYTIHSAAEETPAVDQDMSAFAESINTNAAEIQTLKTNLETMVDFVNAKTSNSEQ